MDPQWKEFRHLAYSRPDAVHLDRKRHSTLRLSSLPLMAISSMINLMFTSFEADTNQVLDRTVDLQDVKRLLELGKILISILTKEELKILEETIMSGPSQVSSTPQNR